MADDSDSGSEKSFEEFEAFEKTLCHSSDPNKESTQLVDLEIIQLLKFCHDLHSKYKHGNEDY